MLTEEDKDLIKRIQEGDSIAEKELCFRFINSIVRKVRSNLGKASEDWKDLVNEIQLAMIISLREGRFDIKRGVSLGSFIFGITMNKIREYFKVYKVQETIQYESNALHYRILEESELEKKELRDILTLLLAKLPLKYKEVLDLRYFEELTIIQISQKLSLSPTKVSERIYYAMKLLRKECKKRNIRSYLDEIR